MIIPTPPVTLRVRVLRSFYNQGKPVAVGSELDLPRQSALELIATHKVELAPVPVAVALAPAAPAQAGTEAKAEPKPKGGKDAG